LGEAVAARMLWVGLYVVGQEVFTGVERFGEAWSDPAGSVQRWGAHWCEMVRRGKAGSVQRKADEGFGVVRLGAVWQEVCIGRVSSGRVRLGAVWQEVCNGAVG
jgi:hypothetical protein